MVYRHISQNIKEIMSHSFNIYGDNSNPGTSSTKIELQKLEIIAQNELIDIQNILVEKKNPNFEKKNIKINDTSGNYDLPFYLVLLRLHF